MKRLIVAALVVGHLVACGTNPGANHGTDTTKPDILLFKATPERVGPGMNVRVTFVVSEKTSKVEAFVAGGAAACAETGAANAFECNRVVVGTEGDGPQPVVAKATDLAGNVGEASLTIVLDSKAPVVTVTKSPAATTNQKDGTIEFVSDEPATFQCSIDGGAPQDCTSPFAFSALAEGKHTVSIAATDDVGNKSTTNVDFTVVTAAPDTRIDQAPPAATRLAQVDVLFSSDVAAATFECSLDSVPFAACTSPLTLSGYAEGPHHFEVRAIDAAGNVDPTPATADFAYDLTAPKTTLDAIPDDGKPSRSISFTASETGCSFACAVDSVAPVACTSPWALAGLADGTHTVSVQATDAAGNVEVAPPSASFVVDTVGPTASFTSTPPNPAYRADETFAFVSSETGSTFECQLDSVAPAPCASPDTVTLTSGSHVFKVVAIDKYGNKGGAASFGWVVDLTAPQVQILSQPAAFTKSRDATITFKGDKPSLTFTCALDGGTAASCGSPVDYTSLPDGAHSVAIVATDGTGHSGGPATASWTVDNLAPQTTIDAIPDTGKTSRTITFSANETGCTFECALDAAAFSSCTSPQSLSGLSDATHTIKVRATDRAGNQESPGASASFVVDTTAPTAQILTGPPIPPLLTTTAAATFSFDASETGCTFECRVDTAAFASCTSATTVTAPNDGAHNFEVRATDKYGNAGTAVSRGWTVDAYPPIVTITAQPANPSNQATGTFSFTANKGGVSFTCAIDSGTPVGCSSPFTTGSLSNGPHTFTVVGTDSGSRQSAPAQAGWTIDTIAPTVSFQTPPSPPALGNQANVTFAFSASESLCTFECSLDGAAYSACNTPKSFTASEAAHTFAVRAKDAAGNTGPASTYPFTVDLTPPGVPAIDQPDPSLTNNTTPTFTWSAATDAVAYAIDIATTYDFGQMAQQAAGLTTLYFTPTPLPSNRYYFRVKAKDAAGNESLYSQTGILEVRTWGFINPRPQGATLLAVSCFDAANCWFVGEAGLAMRTNNGGAGFKQASTGVAGNLNAVYSFTALVAVAVGAGGSILRTTDGGITWFAMSSNVVVDLYGVRFKGQTGYAVGDTGTVLKSIDGGVTWSKLTTGSNVSLRDLAILDGAGNSVVVVGGTGVVLVSGNGGSSWSAGASGTTSQLRAVSFPDAGNGYAVGPAGVMRKTIDGGMTWATVDTKMTKDLYGVLFFDGLVGYTAGDSDMSTNSPLRKTIDGGVNWTEVLTPRPSLRALTFVGATAYAVGDGGNVLKSVDSGATFTATPGVTGTPSNQTQSLAVDQTVHAVRFASTLVGWAFGGRGFAMKTTDGGATFLPLDPTIFAATKDVYAASFFDAQNGWAGGDSSFLARTTDGATWVKPTGAPVMNIRGMHFLTANYGVIVGTNASVYYWNGTAFAQDATIPTLTSNSLRAVRMLDSTHGFIVGDSGTILVNSGSGWVKETSGTTKNLAGVFAFDTSVALAVGDQGTLLRRTGGTWLQASSGTSAALKDVSFVDSQNGWIVGDGVILISADGGINWKKQLCPTGSTLQSVAPVTTDIVYAAGASRNVIKTTLGGR